MSHIPNRAMPHAAPHQPAAEPAPARAAPLKASEWLTVGGIAALAGVGAAALGGALVSRLAR